MKAYYLCYEQKDQFGEIQYIVPALLPQEKPKLPAYLQRPTVQLKLHYAPFIPAGTVNKLMVDKHELIHSNLKWKNNAIFHDPLASAFAHVWEQWEDKAVYINFFGEQLSSLYQQIITALSGLTEKLKNTRFLYHLDFQVLGQYEGNWERGELLVKLDSKYSFLNIKEVEHMNPDKPNNKSTIQNLVGKGSLHEAILLLLSETNVNDKETAIVLQQRYNRVKTLKIRGTVSQEEINIELNKISAAILDLAQALSKHDNTVPEPVEPINNTIDAKIYFSYSWGGEDTRGNPLVEEVNKLYTSLITDGFAVLRDNMDVDYGGLISQYMKELGQGDLIVVFISDKYAKSPYCMFELYEIARNCKWDKELFRSRILPVPLDRIRFDQPDIIEQYFSYWESEEQKWEKLVKNRIAQLSDAQFKRYTNTKQINQNFGTLSDWLIDINSSDIKLLSENDFQMVKEAIKKRINQMKNNR